MSFLAGLAGVGSLVGGLSGLFGHSGSVPQPGPVTPTFSPGQIQETAGQAGSAIQGINQWLPYASIAPQLINQITPQYAGIAQNIGNNRFIQPGVQGQVNAAALAPGLAGQQLGTGMGLTGAGLSQIPYMQQTLNTAFDPQNALYNQLLAQNQNQSNVINAQSGVGNTPYGASLADLNNQNFNIAWQNNLLQRQGQGVQNALGLGQNITGLTGAGLSAGAMAPQTLSALSALPYNFYTGTQQNTLAALQAEQAGLTGQQQTGLSAINAYNVPFNDYNALLASMTGANNQAVNAYTAQSQAQLAAQGQQFNQNAWYGNQIGAGLYGIGKGFPNFNLGFGGQMG